MSLMQIFLSDSVCSLPLFLLMSSLLKRISSFFRFLECGSDQTTVPWQHNEQVSTLFQSWSFLLFKWWEKSLDALFTMRAGHWSIGLINLARQLKNLGEKQIWNCLFLFQGLRFPVVWSVIVTPGLSWGESPIIVLYFRGQWWIYGFPFLLHAWNIPNLTKLYFTLPLIWGDTVASMFDFLFQGHLSCFLSDYSTSSEPKVQSSMYVQVW